MARRPVTAEDIEAPLTAACAGLIVLRVSIGEGTAAAWYSGVVSALAPRWRAWGAILQEAGAPALPPATASSVHTEAADEAELQMTTMGEWTIPAWGEVSEWTDQRVQELAAQQGAALARWCVTEQLDARRRVGRIMDELRAFQRELARWRRVWREAASTAARQVGNWLERWREDMGEVMRELRSYAHSASFGAGVVLAIIVVGWAVSQRKG